jgi:nitrite reductase (NO-forming)
MSTIEDRQEPTIEELEELLRTEHEHTEELDAALAEERRRTEELDRRTRALEGTEGAGAIAGLIAIVGAIVLAVLLLSGVLGGGGGHKTVIDDTPASAPMQMQHALPYKGEVEAYKRPDPTLPAVPAGAVKRFDIDVYEHVTKVAADQPATRVWSYGVNGVLHRGTGASTPMVVNQGDLVRIRLHNGSTQSMHVEFPHSVDFHASEVSPEKAFATIGGGQTKAFTFRARHAGVFMYHCATDPVLMHTGSGMVGMMVVKPKGLAPVDHEYWMTQQEYYIGQPGGNADMAKMEAMKPDVVAFNGYANQYKNAPIEVRAGERIRVYVMNAGPSIWSAFHVIGTVFDRTMIEGQRGHDAQTINLAPSQGGWVEFTLDRPGTYTFLSHSFATMMKGAAGAFQAS